ncbi:hypothetical protein BH09GEM1_BH09GEM1_42210 [soil metagenome]
MLAQHRTSSEHSKVEKDPWLPIGFVLPDGTCLRRTLLTGDQWQIAEADRGSRVLLATKGLAARWEGSGLVADGALNHLAFGERAIAYLVSAGHHTLTAVAEADGANNKNDALAFAAALKHTRLIDQESPLQDALYIEKLSRLLPAYSISIKTPDEVVFGFWLSGGAPVSAQSFRRLHQAVSWLGVDHLREVVEAAGFQVTEVLAGGQVRNDATAIDSDRKGEGGSADIHTEPFQLPGRPELEQFINEHVVDVLRHRERYKALGIGFPSAIVLHGPPGSGKTYAVERLVEYLGWPSYQIDASSVASPFIHETSRKVAELFETAQQNAPSVLVVDEMEAFLADRESGAGSSHHRVEEVAEFLRRIPEATKNNVLIIAMTNRIEMIDSAILRRGRFDHIITVGYASREEVHSLLEKLLGELPTQGALEVEGLAAGLTNRPLSDVTFVVREAARLAARAGKSRLDQQSLAEALRVTPARGADTDAVGRIGFI